MPPPGITCARAIGRGLPVDSVARFHLGNGARLQRLNWLADTSERALEQSYGLMVNYLYDLDYIEAEPRGLRAAACGRCLNRREPAGALAGARSRPGFGVNLVLVIPDRHTAARPESMIQALANMDSGLLASLGPGMTK